MLSQSKIIQLYRQKFPHHSFSAIAEQTGINKSRIFRIFNGQEMRLQELNIFLDIISPAVKDLSEQELNLWAQFELERLSSILERHFSNYLLCRYPRKNQANLLEEAL